MNNEDFTKKVHVRCRNGKWSYRFEKAPVGGKRKSVAPLAGAWIEIGISRCLPSGALVAPLAGAWIETPSLP